jgi:DNA-binding Lrp family transcriptional regulator
MLLDSQQKEFIDKIVYERKSVYTVAKEMELPVNLIFDWYDEFFEEISQLKIEQALDVVEEYDLLKISELEYLAKLHNKLRNELENRDFSGLPTDKLYTLLTDVRTNIDKILITIHDKNENWNDDFLEDFLDDDFDEDEDL